MVEFDAFRYRIPLCSSLNFGGVPCTEREGLVITPPGSKSKYGDAAPLPGLSHETVQELANLRASPPPSLRFALDGLRSECPSSVTSIPIAALLWGAPESLWRRVELLRCSGHPCIKLKVGGSRIVEQIEIVRQVRSRIRSDQTLRLDANRAWSLTDAVEFGSAIADLQIEFIEEPTQNPADLNEFFERTQVPYALDETLIEAPQLDQFHGVAALVVKPTLLGGRDDIASLAEHGLPLVFSSCFESGIGVWNIGRLAAEFSPQIAAGLDSYRWIARDVLVSPLQMDDGHLVVGHKPEIDWSMLAEIER